MVIGSGFAEVGERAFDRFPCGILREISAEHDLKCRLCRPPMLRTVDPGKLIVHAAQAFGRARGADGLSPQRVLLRRRLQLDFPLQDAGAGGGGFGFRYVARGLQRDGERGVRQRV